MLLVRSPHLEFFLDLSKTKVAVCFEPALRPGEEDVLDAAVVVLLPLGDVLQVGVEDEAVHHHVGRHEQPDVDHLDVGMIKVLYWSNQHSSFDALT